MKAMVLTVVVFTANVISGCSQMETTEERLSIEAESAILEENSLTTNALDLNGLFSNAIDLNGIDPTLLSSEARQSIEASGEIGTNSRLVYKYLIGCALDSSQSVSFSWTDSSSVVHNEVYWGSIGLATSWQQGSISTQARRIVSACLGARANFYGTAVVISIRGPQAAINQPGAQEKTDYPMEEGVFWGDVFNSTPQIYACHNDANIANSRSKLRDCAAGHVNVDTTISECAHIAILGDCDTLCTPPDANTPYRSECDDGIAPATTDVITIYLPQ